MCGNIKEVTLKLITHLKPDCLSPVHHVTMHSSKGMQGFSPKIIVSVTDVH
jgi:hypothetical protein